MHDKVYMTLETKSSGGLQQKLVLTSAGATDTRPCIFGRAREGIHAADQPRGVLLSRCHIKVDQRVLVKGGGLGAWLKVHVNGSTIIWGGGGGGIIPTPLPPHRYTCKCRCALAWRYFGLLVS